MVENKSEQPIIRGVYDVTHPRSKALKLMLEDGDDNTVFSIFEDDGVGYVKFSNKNIVHTQEVVETRRSLGSVDLDEEGEVIGVEFLGIQNQRLEDFSILNKKQKSRIATLFEAYYNIYS